MQPLAISVVGAGAEALVTEVDRLRRLLFFDCVGGLAGPCLVLLTGDGPVAPDGPAVVEKPVEVESFEDVIGFGLLAHLLFLPRGLVPVPVRSVVLLLLVALGRTDSIAHLRLLGLVVVRLGAQAVPTAAVAIRVGRWLPTTRTRERVCPPQVKLFDAIDVVFTFGGALLAPFLIRRF